MIDAISWHKTYEPRKFVAFVGTPGPTSHLPNNNQTVPKAIDLFSKYFNYNVISLFFTKTNNFAEKKRVEENQNGDWSPVTVDEMKALLGMCMFMGTILPKSQ